MLSAIVKSAACVKLAEKSPCEKPRAVAGKREQKMEKYSQNPAAFPAAFPRANIRPSYILIFLPHLSSAARTVAPRNVRRNGESYLRVRGIILLDMQIKPFKGPDELPEVLACLKKKERERGEERRRPRNGGRKRAKFRRVDAPETESARV